MGGFDVQFEVSDQAGQYWLTLEGLVDTGSTYTWIPRDTLEGLSIAPRFQREFETADGRVIVRDVAVAQMRLDGLTLPTLVEPAVTTVLLDSHVLHLWSAERSASARGQPTQSRPPTNWRRLDLLV